MKIVLRQPLAANSAADSYDVRQIKSALNRLGYYQPLDTVGITDMTDRAMFEAITAYQRASGLPATGQLRPDDATIDRLNRDLSAAPAGFYIWRTVRDGKTRTAHAALDGQIRAWSDSPDPTEDFNCRCWAEPVRAVQYQAKKGLTEEGQKALDKAKRDLSSFEKDDYSLAARFLRNYLEQTEGDITLNINDLNKSPVLLEALAKNRSLFEKTIIGKGDTSISQKISTYITSLPDGGGFEFNDYWDADIKKDDVLYGLGNILFGRDGDFYNAFGSVKIRSNGNFRLYRVREIIRVEGKVTHSLDDTYDFNSDGLDEYAFKDYRLLADKGYAKTFKVHWQMAQPVTGVLTFRHGKIYTGSFNWGEMGP